MTALERPPVAAGRGARLLSRASRSAGERPKLPGRVATAERALWMVPPVVTLAVMLWGIRGASYSLDESATLSAVQRPLHSLLRMLERVDAVHGVYYAVIWPIVELLGPSELATRLPSAVAMAVAAAGIFAIGKRLVSPWAGLAAGLVFAVLPQISDFGQTARPYAMATALATIASYLLVRALQAAAEGKRLADWMIGYAACLATLGWIHIFGLLLVAAHVVPVATAWRRRAKENGNRLVLSWLLAVMCAVLLVAPLILASRKQLGTSLSWAAAPTSSQFLGLTGLIGPRHLAAAAGLAVLCAITVSAIAGWARLRERFPGDLIALCLPWLLVPATVLIIASIHSPVYVFRYVLFCVPAAALLVGAALAALGRIAGITALAIITAIAVPSLVNVRAADGHGVDIRATDRIIARDMRRGDALLYLRLSQPIEAAYPYGLAQLHNVELGLTGRRSATLGGIYAPWQVVAQREERVDRIWIVELAAAADRYSPSPVPAGLAKLGFREAAMWHPRGIWLMLYVRSGGQAS